MPDPYGTQLKNAWRRLEELATQAPDAVDEDTYSEAAEVIDSIRLGGLKRGFGDLLPRPIQAMSLHDALNIVGRLMERMRERGESCEPGQKKKADDATNVTSSAGSSSMTVANAAKYLNCGQNTIRDMCKSES